jgi:hypothetical protein
LSIADPDQPQLMVMFGVHDGEPSGSFAPVVTMNRVAQPPEASVVSLLLQTSNPPIFPGEKPKGLKPRVEHGVRACNSGARETLMKQPRRNARLAPIRHR